MTPRIRLARPWRVVVLFLAAAVMAWPAVVSAHAELVSASPADGETVVGTPSEIHATYSETLDPDGSSLGLVAGRDPEGTRIAKGGVVADGGPKEMFIRNLPTLAPGVYTVRSTTRSADDGDIERVSWSFTVSAPAPSATPEPTPICTDGCNGQSTDGPTASPTASPIVTPTPGATPAPSSGTSSGSDVILPIIAALAFVAVAGYVLLARGRRTPPRG